MVYIGSCPQAINLILIAIIAEGLWHEGVVAVKETCGQLSISNTTLYNYLRYRGMERGAAH